MSSSDNRLEVINKELVYYNVRDSIYFNTPSVQLEGRLNQSGDIQLEGNFLGSDTVFYNFDTPLVQFNGNSTQFNGQVDIKQSIVFAEYDPAQKANTLYQLGGNLFFGQTQLGSGSSGGNVFNDLTITGNLTVGKNATVSGNITAPNILSNSLFGNLYGNLIGTQLGNIQGNLIGNSYGTHIGNVQGNLIGDSYGLHIGNVQGNLVGNSYGTHFGNIVATLANVEYLTVSNITPFNPNINIQSNAVIDGELYVSGNIRESRALYLNGYNPSTTSNALYNRFGNLYWNNTQLDILGGNITVSNIIISNGGYQWQMALDGSNGDLVLYKYISGTYTERFRFN